MLPLLRHFADGEEHANQETADILAGGVQLTEAERGQLLPSGKQTIFTNRVAWAKSHLKQAGLIDSPRRGIYRLTERGREVLHSHSGPITLRFLDQFPEHRAFRSQTKAAGQVADSQPSNTLTPQEYIESGYQQIRATLAAELLTRVKECSPDFFERLVIELLLAMGYGGHAKRRGRPWAKAAMGASTGSSKKIVSALT
jgi:restriction system protein